MEEEYNIEKSPKSCKSPLLEKESCNRIKKSAIFISLTKVMILIDIHVDIKPMIKSTFGICRCGGNI